MGIFKTVSPAIVSEVIDGEAIIIDMRSGTYFAADGVGAALWSAALAGQSREALVAETARCFEKYPAAVADAEHFLSSLLENDLLLEEETTDVSGSSVVLPDHYSAPLLQRHSDMQDLIMLDPIHDVDTMGWPTPRDETRAPSVI